MKTQTLHTEDGITAIYQSPTITTYTADELLDMVGPVLAGGVSDACNGVMDPSCSTGYYAPEDDSGEHLL